MARVSNLPPHAVSTFNHTWRCTASPQVRAADFTRDSSAVRKAFLTRAGEIEDDAINSLAVESAFHLLVRGKTV